MLSTGSLNGSHRAVAFALALVAIPGLQAAEQEAAAVSPGSAVIAEPLAGSCPTFAWSGADAASGYELVVYRMTEDGTLETVLQTRVTGDARAWTPSAAECPDSGARYAWAVRALTGKGAGPWSKLLLFETPRRPTDDEVRQAIEMLRRYQQDRGERAGSTSLTAAAPPADSTARSERLPSHQHVALKSPSGGATPSPQTVVAPASALLTIDGAFDLGGYVFKDGVPFLHNDGGAGYKNTALGLNALISATPGEPEFFYGATNSAFGYAALQNNTTGNSNTAIGDRTLANNDEGFRNTAVGYLGLYSNLTGHRNTSVGAWALFTNTTGYRNTATGYTALRFNETGSHNTATGNMALFANTTGHRNTATGARALRFNVDGYRNVATGYKALFNNDYGSYNTAVGYRAMYSNNSVTGHSNTAVGSSAGTAWTTGSYNVAIGLGAIGTAGESGTIRIGGSDMQSATFIEGINTFDAAAGDPVCVTGDDQFGLCEMLPSSRRFKRDIRDLENASNRLHALRPVSFRYRQEMLGKADTDVYYGLIAEEVAEVFPHLVMRDAEGRPRGIRYELLTPLLLDRVQRQDEELGELRRQMADRHRVVADLRRRLDSLAKEKRFR